MVFKVTISFEMASTWAGSSLDNILEASSLPISTMNWAALAYFEAATTGFSPDSTCSVLRNPSPMAFL